MAHTRISQIEKLYELPTQVSVKHITVSHPKFREFSHQLSGFIQATKDLADDEFWTAPLKALKRYRFEMSVAPLGFGNKETVSDETIERLDRAVESSQFYDHNFSEGFKTLVGNLKILVEVDDNPFLDEIFQILTKHSELALVLKESRHISRIEKILFENGISQSIEIISESQLRKPRTVKKPIVCVGAGRWYQDYIFRTPRSEEIIVLKFPWIRDFDCRQKSVFSGSKNVTEFLSKKNPSYRQIKTSEESSSVETNVPVNQECLEDEELIPSLNLSSVGSKYALQYEATDSVMGRLFHLEGRCGIFLEAEENGTTLVIDLDDDEKNRVHRTVTKHIQPGMFVLLRADEGEDYDYIIPVANRLLGKKAPQYRELQRSWKNKLKEIIDKKGFDASIALLKQNGSIRANEINLRNWLSERNIRPADYRDFLAIMKSIGAEELAEKCWNFASEIDKAHLLAGSRIRKQLLRKVLNSDLSELERRGELKFELEELDTKPLLALRVIRIADQSTAVSANQINKIFELEEDKWLG